MFIGRTVEMSELNRLYGTGSFEMPVIYGRRRVGKTRLITEFIQGKKAIYFQARRTNAEANLHGFSQAILAGSVGVAGVSFRSFDEAFDALATMARTERLIVVIDEYPYLAQSNPEISSLLQDKIDHLYKETKLMLILCGSSLSFMEEQVLGYESPLYGRRTAQFKIMPLDFMTTPRPVAEHGSRRRCSLLWHDGWHSCIYRESRSCRTAQGQHQTSFSYSYGLSL